MRRFTSYGPINRKLHYYAPREELINKAFTQLTGGNPGGDGHYVTVWAPRQTGKTWVMQELVEKIRQSSTWCTAGMFSMERAKKVKSSKAVLEVFCDKLREVFAIDFPTIKEFRHLPALFTKKYFKQPLILIIDEFDALQEEFIDNFAAIFRDLFISRTNEKNKKSSEKNYLLHGLALIGVRSVLGIENVSGSPFNVQRSLQIPNLTSEEVNGMFQWYEKESKRDIEPGVIDRLFFETRGQPGLTCWFGELLTEGFDEYEIDPSKPVTMRDFEITLAAATYALPNNNIQNIISKAKTGPEKELVFEMFRTDEKLPFSYDDPVVNSLYMHGIATKELEDMTRYYLRFSCPFVQKRLFNYFSRQLFRDMGELIEPFTDISAAVSPNGLDIREIMKLYQKYLTKNKSWLFNNAPRRNDMRIFEAVFHFNLYSFLSEFLRTKKGRVFPEFPTGNGKIDLLVTYENYTYGIELKSFSDRAAYQNALLQAARYGEKLQLEVIFLVIFVESIDDDNRQKYEVDCNPPGSDIVVKPVFISTGKV